MDKTDRNEINRVQDKDTVRKIDAKARAKEAAFKQIARRNVGAMVHRPRGY